MTTDLPLGRDVDYPTQYAPQVLAPIARQSSRDALGIDANLPFQGEDQWTAWELTWLQADGRPAVAAAEITVPANSPSIVESKSLKLYLNSFAMSQFDDSAAVARRIRQDLSETTGTDVRVRLFDRNDDAHYAIHQTAAAICVDDEPADFAWDTVRTNRLRVVKRESASETLYSELFRSLCPVTSQPDFATVFVSYSGKRIDRTSLLEYIVSFREHQDFHEACVERLFIDLMQACQCDRLTVSARFLRRGGIDINPWRSTDGASPAIGRVWRQ